MRAPSGATAPTGDQRLAGTGTAEATNPIALTTREMATLRVGSQPVRVAFLAATGDGSEVPTTALALPAYGAIDWYVDDSGCDQYVAIEAADGAAVYEAWVWTSSGPRVPTAPACSMVGTSAGDATVAATLSLVTYEPFAGDAAGDATPSATLSLVTIAAFAGDATGDATTDGATLSNVAGMMTGDATGDATVTATMVDKAGQMSGNADGVALVSGTLTMG